MQALNFLGHTRLAARWLITVMAFKPLLTILDVFLKKKSDTLTKPLLPQKPMDLRPVRPRAASLAELLLCGVLTEEEVMAGGRVSDDVRRRAECAWAQLAPRRRPLRPRTAPPARRLPASPPSPPPRPPPRRPPATRVPSSVSHVARVRLRRSLTDDEAARHPQSLALDVCCVCYGTF